MKIVMTLLVRDEEDIIDSTIDFHLAQGVDHVLAMDNRSVDNTSSILKGYERMGRLTYIPQLADDYSQGQWVTNMARRACLELEADWIINSDADEFWWPERGDLVSTLSAVAPEILAVRAERTNFLPPSVNDPRHFSAAMTVRESVSCNMLGRPLPPKVCHRARPNVVVAQGNHSVLFEGEAVSAVSAGLEIMHFPLRSYSQFANKIAAGGAAYARNTELPRSVGDTWRTLRERQLRGHLRADYDTQVLSPTEIEAGVAAGRLRRDYRVRDILSELAQGHV